SLLRPPPLSTLFPYTTLFRSLIATGCQQQTGFFRQFVTDVLLGVLRLLIHKQISWCRGEQAGITGICHNHYAFRLDPRKVACDKFIGYPEGIIRWWCSIYRQPVTGLQLTGIDACPMASIEDEQIIGFGHQLV